MLISSIIWWMIGHSDDDRSLRSTRQSQGYTDLSDQFVTSDTTILDILRKCESLSIGQMSEAMSVTATAVRQRLTRLMAQGYIERYESRAGRGRPSHRYRLTDKGRRKTGENFADLAIALWQEIRSVADPAIRRGMFQRISSRMAEMYGDQIEGDTLDERMGSLARIFQDRNISLEVDFDGKLPVLKAHACPYPELAEQDRTICAMERMMFSEVLGAELRLNECRLDGEDCCTFSLADGSSDSLSDGLSDSLSERTTPDA
ncbi:MAG: DeoR family suf operon transcriptional repressor [Pirellulaceae bacterium]|jgi:DeoR family suf operon transcriptional repressor